MKGLLVIQLDDNILKIIQGYATTNGWQIERFVSEDISGRSEDDVSAILKDILHKNKIKKSATILVIPRGLVTVRYLQLPTTDPDELDNMVGMQVVRQIPYTREEMVYDYYVMETTEEGYTKVFLAIIHKDIISKNLRIFQKAGIVPDSIELDSLSIVELCKSLGIGISGGKSVVVIDMDYVYTNIVIMQNGVPVFTRAVSIGTMHLEDKIPPPIGKDWISEWCAEINRSLKVFQREQGVSIEKVVLIGNYVRHIANVASRLDFSVSGFDLSPYIVGLSLSNVNVSIVSLLGAIKEGVNTSINLIPEETRDFMLAKARRKSMVMTGVLIAGIIGVFGLTLNKKIQDRRLYLASLEERLRQTNPIAKDLELKKERLNLIKKQLSLNGTSLDVLRELYSIIPQRTSLNVFIYDEKQGVTIKGASPAMSEVFDIVPKLEKSPYFGNVTTRYATQRKIKGQELTEFHIDCSITIPED